MGKDSGHWGGGLLLAQSPSAALLTLTPGCGSPHLSFPQPPELLEIKTTLPEAP